MRLDRSQTRKTRENIDWEIFSAPKSFQSSLWFLKCSRIILRVIVLTTAFRLGTLIRHYSPLICILIHHIYLKRGHVFSSKKRHCKFHIRIAIITDLQVGIHPSIAIAHYLLIRSLEISVENLGRTTQ